MKSFLIENLILVTKIFFFCHSEGRRGGEADTKIIYNLKSKYKTKLQKKNLPNLT
jgi:hypothetical protein